MPLPVKSKLLKVSGKLPQRLQHCRADQNSSRTQLPKVPYNTAYDFCYPLTPHAEKLKITSGNAKCLALAHKTWIGDGRPMPQKANLSGVVFLAAAGSGFGMAPGSKHGLEEDSRLPAPPPRSQEYVCIYI